MESEKRKKEIEKNSAVKKMLFRKKDIKTSKKLKVSRKQQKRKHEKNSRTLPRKYDLRKKNHLDTHKGNTNEECIHFLKMILPNGT